MSLIEILEKIKSNDDIFKEETLFNELSYAIRNPGEFVSKFYKFDETSKINTIKSLLKLYPFSENLILKLIEESSFKITEPFFNTLINFLINFIKNKYSNLNLPDLSDKKFELENIKTFINTDIQTLESLEDIRIEHEELLKEKEKIELKIKKLKSFNIDEVKNEINIKKVKVETEEKEIEQIKIKQNEIEKMFQKTKTEFENALKIKTELKNKEEEINKLKIDISDLDKNIEKIKKTDIQKTRRRTSVKKGTTW